MSLATPVLSRSEHDRIGHRRSDAVWLEQAWSDERSRVLVLSADGRAATTRSAAESGGLFRPRLRLLSPGQAHEAGLDRGLRLLLGEHEDVAYFAILTEETVSGTEWQGLRLVATELNALDSGLFTAAVAIQAWHRSHTHCPRCGAATEPNQAGWVRVCTVDGSQHFPRTDPAVIMLIEDDEGRCLLGRAPAWPPGRFSVLAGFVEAGESAEAAVAREVTEEVGIVVTDIRYQASQPHPFPASLMLGFTARAAGDPTLHIDDDEIAEAGWYTREEVRRAADWGDAVDAAAIDAPAPTDSAPVPMRALPPASSIARQLIDTWLSAR